VLAPQERDELHAQLQAQQQAAHEVSLALAAATAAQVQLSAALEGARAELGGSHQRLASLEALQQEAQQRLREEVSGLLHPTPPPRGPAPARVWPSLHAPHSQLRCLT
jgi:hypothetical protein